MKTLAVVALLGTSVVLGGIPQPAHALTTSEIMNRNFVVTRVIDSTAHTTMTLTNRSGKQRIRKTFGTTKLKKNSLDNKRMTQFLSPTDIKGTVSLLIENSEKDDDIWIYLPSLKKVRRLVSSNKKDSFIGTDFSYGDVIGHKVRDWKHTLVREEKFDDQPCYVIESIPANKSVRSDSGYSKRVSWIRKDIFVTVKALAYDEANELIKEFRFSHYVEVDPERGKWFARDLEAHNVQRDHRTLIRIDDYKVNVGVKDSYFTTRYMKRR
jgi:outer membrane lipoprotein-sorting protein